MLRTILCYGQTGTEEKGTLEKWSEEVTFDDKDWMPINEKRINRVWMDEFRDFFRGEMSDEEMEKGIEAEDYPGVYLYYIGDGKDVRRPEGMLHCCHTFDSYEGGILDLTNFDTSDVVNMVGMFTDCKCKEIKGLSDFDTSSVVNMNSMFYGCDKLEKIDMSACNVVNVTEVTYMFGGCKALEELSLPKFSSALEYAQCLFEGCISLKSVDLSKLNISNVDSLFSMFMNCFSLKEADLSMLDGSKVEDARGMFAGCHALPLDNFKFFKDTSNLKYTTSMFTDCAVGEEFGEEGAALLKK